MKNYTSYDNHWKGLPVVQNEHHDALDRIKEVDDYQHNDHMHAARVTVMCCFSMCTCSFRYF